jgi:hypothetical protein
LITEYIYIKKIKIARFYLLKYLDGRRD